MKQIIVLIFISLITNETDCSFLHLLTIQYFSLCILFIYKICLLFFWLSYLQIFFPFLDINLCHVWLLHLSYSVIQWLFLTSMSSWSKNLNFNTLKSLIFFLYLYITILLSKYLFNWFFSPIASLYTVILLIFYLLYLSHLGLNLTKFHIYVVIFNKNIYYCISE